MGTICEPAEEIPPFGEELKIWGNYLSPDTRAYLVICRLTDVRVKLELMDRQNKSLKDKHLSERLPEQADEIPMISDGFTTIIHGDDDTQIEYLTRKYPSIMAKMSPPS